MLDIKYIRENPEKVKRACYERGGFSNIDKILGLDKEMRGLLQMVEQLRAEQKKLGREHIEQAREIKEELKIRELQLEDVEQQLKVLLYKLPNIPLENVPFGKDSSENVVLKTWGKIPSFKFEPKDHLELGEALDIIDVKRAAEVSGSRFAYLKGDAVLLEFALVRLALDTVAKEGFIPIIPPALIKEGVAEGLGYWDDEEGRENYYVIHDTRCYRCGHNLGVSGKSIFCHECNKLIEQEITQDERLKCHQCGRETRLTSFYLIGTAEHSIAPMHSNELLEKLPKRYIGFSSSFRREAGSYGKDTRGILRVHQFDKLELFSITKPQESQREHELLLSLEEKLWQQLKIPYQVVQLCVGDMSRPSAATYDIEAWMPGQKRYREVSSASNTTDFQARRLNIKFRNKENKMEFVHMLNATGFAIGRTLIAILENYQQKDGSIKIPKVLQKYAGISVIPHRSTGSR
ncbi:MAG: serine--tRNA ligase [Candidatus Wildermuthbacteria bacterium RIFCSPLOWO2_02_FULL_47_9c]|uniref:Serine--tRNA ligase n=1 Tax=Candidatus Wildermuthbacteria bacterium RIFCSPLOWO2_02_FULL_47_9c TaxID=1802466 RepID=A0A1G2RWF7_9BACT|nr:MAG: serine--tRNA ligase [Candidatus Wildermuthbacteria bacterium RIFCSPLOWO2_02_FULL_47_9c]